MPRRIEVMLKAVVAAWLIGGLAPAGAVLALFVLGDAFVAVFGLVGEWRAERRRGG